MECVHLCRAEKARARAGVSFVELIVVLGIITLLVSLLLPALGKAREAARATQCKNNLRNIAVAMLQFHDTNNRFPASGYILDPPRGPGGLMHSWAVAILPFIERSNLHSEWDFEKRITDSPNDELRKTHIPLFICPIDITRNKEKGGDLSYAVNGGWGFTFRTADGVRDCPGSWHGGKLDMNGDGITCSGTIAVDDKDRDLFKKTGMFFLENWNEGGTVRHHSLNTVSDGASHTFMISENVRTGFDPKSINSGFANPRPRLSAFYIGNPCRSAVCSQGNVDYSRCNSGSDRINSGLWSPEGQSPVPNSFHDGGVNMAYVDGHVAFLSEGIDGGVYAALASPQGGQLDDTPIRQPIPSGDSF